MTIDPISSALVRYSCCDCTVDPRVRKIALLALGLLFYGGVTVMTLAALQHIPFYSLYVGLGVSLVSSALFNADRVCVVNTSPNATSTQTPTPVPSSPETPKISSLEALCIKYHIEEHLPHLQEKGIVHAIEQSFNELIVPMLSMGFDGSVVNEDGSTLLHIAAQSKNPEAFAYFLKYQPHNALKKNAGGFTPLYYCANQPLLKQIFLANFDDLFVFHLHAIELRPEFRTIEAFCIAYAASSNSVELLEAVLQLGISPNLQSVDCRCTLIHVAARFGSPEVFETLLQGGCTPWLTRMTIGLHHYLIKKPQKLRILANACLKYYQQDLSHADNLLDHDRFTYMINNQLVDLIEPYVNMGFPITWTALKAAVEKDEFQLFGRLVTLGGKPDKKFFENMGTLELHKGTALIFALEEKARLKLINSYRFGIKLENLENFLMHLDQTEHSEIDKHIFPFLLALGASMPSISQYLWRFASALPMSHIKWVTPIWEKIYSKQELFEISDAFALKAFQFASCDTKAYFLEAKITMMQQNYQTDGRVYQQVLTWKWLCSEWLKKEQNGEMKIKALAFKKALHDMHKHFNPLANE